MKRLLILFVAMVVSGCVQTGSIAKPIPVLAGQEVLNAQARLVYLCCAMDSESADDDTDDSPKPATCSCGGSKRSGDGIGPCECVANGKECKCGSGGEETPEVFEPPEASEPEIVPEVKPAPVVKLLVIVGEPGTCPPCEQFKRNELPKLVASGWKVGVEETDQIEVMLWSDFQARYGADIRGVPCFAVTVDGELQVDSIITGFTTAVRLADHVNAYRTGAKRTERSTVRIVAHGQGKIAWVTGVVIESHSKGMKILTCGHLMDMPQTTEVEIFGSKGIRKLKANLLKRDKRADVALYAVETDEPLPAVEVFTGDVPKGSILTAWGCDEGGEPRFRRTKVSEAFTDEGVPKLWTEGDAAKGLEADPVSGRSGGGLFLNGKLIGIYSAADRIGKRGLIVSVRALELLK